MKDIKRVNQRGLLKVNFQSIPEVKYPPLLRGMRQLWVEIKTEPLSII